MEKNKSIIDDNDDIAVISIVDPGVELIWTVRESLQNCDRLRQLKFTDTEPSPFLKYGWLTPASDCFMDHAQARILVKFIYDLVSSDKQWSLIVHCAAGICRSGAIGSFAQAFSAMSDAEFAATNPRVQPNMWVYNKLIEVWYENFKDHMKPIHGTL
jgi:predicted protein tyrosine phosphatase